MGSNKALIDNAIMLVFMTFVLLSDANASANYVMPEESTEHEGTWLQWPHQYTYGISYRNALDSSWLAMTAALVNSEKVHIIAYDTTEKNRIIALLNNENIPLAKIDFFIHQNDDVWIRDNGPIFVYDSQDRLTILDFGFNGWGNDTVYSKCDAVPTAVAGDLSLPLVDLSALVLEGGAVEIDGKGTMMATRSSVTHASRNSTLSEAEIESYLTTYLGIQKFIWLDGVYGSEITDMHIDGFVRFANSTTIVTMSNSDLLNWEVSQADINTLYAASDVNGVAYNFVYVPLTQNNVQTSSGKKLGYKGSYCNYYIANTVVLVPNYNDPHDSVANEIIQNLYPGKTVIGIDVRDFYEYGGMVHCVTQQQPVAPQKSSLKGLITSWLFLLL